MKLTGALAEKGFHESGNDKHTHGAHDIPRLWVIVADRVKAHIYRKTPEGLEMIGDATAIEGKAQLGKTDNYSVTRAGGSGAGHGHDPRQKKQHHGDKAFIHSLSLWLEEAEREKAFDLLALVAAPHTLGDIRSALSKAVHARVTIEIDKDLTNLSENDIRDHLKDVVWFQD